MADKGHRYATPNTRIMIHQPSIHGFIRGQATDLEIQAKEILKLRKQLVRLYADHTGQSEEIIEENFDRDNWMSVQEAIDFGLLDKVVTSSKDLP
jgi:ATP-dependent Clp protease protease subunit